MKKRSAMFLVSVLAMSACAPNKVQVDETTMMTKALLKQETRYVDDNTTEVLVDAEIKKEDIERVVKHGDHWHVFTKDGKERITYVDPATQTGGVLSFTPVVSLSQLSGKDVVTIEVHGDHWHVKTRDGKEYLTYENPSALFKHVAVTQYQGNHGIVARPQGNSTNQNNADVVKILKHGDHYHVYTRDGQEFIVYSNPRHLYPNAYYGEYQGSHDNVVVTKPVDNHSDNHIHKPVETPKDKPKLDIIRVVKADFLKTLNIVKISKHGDHYHAYTKDGKEYISYDNLEKAFPHLIIGEFEGSHGDTKEQVPVLAIKHGNHWHLYADMAGTTEIGTSIEDPRIKYPNIKVEEDTDHNDGHDHDDHNHDDHDGHHHDHQEEPSDTDNSDNEIVPILAIQDGEEWYLYSDMGGEKEVGMMTGDPREKYPNIKLIYEDIFDDSDVPEDAEPVLAKRHGNHWHLYADLAAKKPLGVVFTDPRYQYPNIKIEEYNEEEDGSHGDLEDDVHEDDTDTTVSSDTENIESTDETSAVNVDDEVDIEPVLAKKHEDHWHLYADLEGKKEIGVVTTDPSLVYPNIKIEEYEGSHDTTEVPVDNEEIVDDILIDGVPYDEIIPEKIVPLNKPYMHMVYGLVAYASSDNTFGVTHYFGEKVFVVPHINHYHNMSVATIIDYARQDLFEGYSAKDVVATFKYYIENPSERPKKAGWGTEFNVPEQQEDPAHIALKIDYLKRVYQIEDKRDIQIIDDEIKIWSTNPYTTIHLSDLIVENGEVKPLINLPNLP